MPEFLDQYERLLGPSEKSGGYTYCPCPFPGCDGHDEPRLSINVETGGWYCFRCNFQVPEKEYGDSPGQGGGGWREFVALMGDEENLRLWEACTGAPLPPQPEPLDVARRTRIWTKLFRYSTLHARERLILELRGLDPDRLGAVSAEWGVLARLEEEEGRDLLVAAGLCRADAEELKPSLCGANGRILVPYRKWEKGKERVVYFIGYQKLLARQAEESEADYQFRKRRHVKTAGPKGYTPALYGLHEIPADARFVVVTEGQFKAAASLQRGIPAVGLQGITSQHKPAATALSKLGVRSAILCFDTQLEGQDEVDRQEAALARELLKKGIRPFRCRLPLDEGTEKQDIDSLLLTERGLERYGASLLQAARAPYLFDTEWSSLMV